MAFSIKQSLADCSSCKLLDAPSCIMETNSKADLTKVDIVVISENPGKDEIKKGVPLIGRAGKTFRKYFDKYIKKDFKWLLTNCVLYLTLDEDGNTGNPDDETIERVDEILKLLAQGEIIPSPSYRLKRMDFGGGASVRKDFD